MVDYARFRLLTEISEATDYSNSYIQKELTDTFGPAEVRYQKIETDTGGTTLTISNFAAINAFWVYNTDSTNFVTLVYDSAGSASNEVKLSAGEFFYTSDVNRGTNPSLTADTAACECIVVLVGT